jgi:hypothetical protein
VTLIFARARLLGRGDGRPIISAILTCSSII